ncbi:SET domain-containing protein [Fomitiporia mediterranea MF3/22]|uniref:SET domain-containing protein n=1 Tax=Fomitiporia mediterranea (strain MF3/22) TaxID=694068 RepID=UPI00044086C5|nr:SET domain-containing protein [Fomitiporia mediterranea MF3/22]EJD02658.1 SET domain-containing protein [Fomitiporia mediterranea MF3/22]
MDNFIRWFVEEGGWLDRARIGIVDTPSQGRAAIALQDIPEGHTLFSVPRSLTLSTHTSELPKLIGEAAWKSLRLNKGWVGLILCMMWEECRWTDSKWCGYFNILPRAFDTPMFWTGDELKELDGTDVLGKIGKEQAERDYYEILNPAVRTRPDLFDPGHIASFYSLENYHVMGSRILSRSFHVEKWKEQTPGSQSRASSELHENGDCMDIDDESSNLSAVGAENGGDDDSDDEAENPSDIAMVPMADMLNAQYGSENAKLFYEPTHLNMVSTKPIRRGEQIYNAYGDLPNSALLREYGHVDLVPLPGVPWKEGNPADVVEIPADLALHAVLSSQARVDAESLKERIDWWLEEGGDDVFVLGTDLELPDVMISFLKLLLLSKLEWEKARSKSKPPKPKLDMDSKLQTFPLVLGMLERRLAKYPTTLEHDEALLSGQTSLPYNVRNAIIVRIGEKHILVGCMSKVRASLEEAQMAVRNGIRPEKQLRHQNSVGNQKKRKRGDIDEEEKPRKQSWR